MVSLGRVGRSFEPLSEGCRMGEYCVSTAGLVSTSEQLWRW